MAIPRDPYARNRGRLTYGQEKCIIALGNHDKPLREQDIKSVVGRRELLTQLEEKGYAFAPTVGKMAGTWMLTESGIRQYRRLKFGIKP